jgi:hypothetical protein
VVTRRHGFRIQTRTRTGTAYVRIWMDMASDELIASRTYVFGSFSAVLSKTILEHI